VEPFRTLPLMINGYSLDLDAGNEWWIYLDGRVLAGPYSSRPRAVDAAFGMINRKPKEK
jgi:hypothetical protein